MTRRPCARLTLALVAIALAVGAYPLIEQRLSGQGARPGAAVVIRGATILTVTKGTIANGTIVLRDGKIAAIGANVDVPAGAEVVDASGMFVTPGLIDAHSHITADSINEGGTTVSSMTGIEDVFNPTDIDVYRDLAGGLTMANILHGSANPIGGKNAVIKLRWGKTKAEDFLFDGAVPGIKFALGENPKRPGSGQARGPRRYPATRPGVEYVIREAFTRAKAYQAAWKAYEKRKAAGEDVRAPARDLQLEPLVEILEGKRLVHAHAYRADEMLMLMRLSDEMGFKIASFEHTLEGYKVAKELAARGIVASSFADWWGYKEEVIDAIPYSPAIMTKKGVTVAISSDSAEHARRLNTEAAKAIKWGGLSEDEALRLVTLNPAKSLHVDKRVGSLEVGKDADVVIWTRHPLSTYAIVERTYIDGIAYYDRKKDELRVAELMKEKAAIVKAATPAAPPKSDAPAAIGGGSGVAHEAVRGVGALASDGPVMAIVNARILPVTSAPIERGTILVRGGRIAEIGASVQVPAGAQVIDAEGGEVYPGWINAATSLGITEPGPGGWYNDNNEMLDYNPQLRTRVAWKADSDAIPVARSNGVTAVAAVPSGGTLGGEVPVMNLDGWTWEEATVRPSAGIAFRFPALAGGGGFSFGEAPASPERTYEDLKKDRDRKLADLADLFDRARAYARAGSGRPTDWTLEALVPIVEGTQPLFTAVRTAPDIKEALAFAERAKVRIVIGAGPEAALVAPLLKEKNVPVILGSILTLPSREDMFHAASYQAAGELSRAGVKFAFSTGDATNVRLLPYHAAMAVAWGLPRDEAIKALTINAADILGVSDVMGSLEPGKLASFFIAAGDPLEIRTAVTHVFINGRNVGVQDRHYELYEKWMARR